MWSIIFSFFALICSGFLSGFFYICLCVCASQERFVNLLCVTISVILFICVVTDGKGPHETEH